MYTFLFVSPNGSIPAFDFEVCPDDEAARLAAQQLLHRQPERLAVEVWNDRGCLFVLERGEARP